METEEFKNYFFKFKIGKKNFALPLYLIERVIQSTAITDIPNAPNVIRGLLNYKGNIIPLLDISEKFKIKFKNISISNHFIIIQTDTKKIALFVHDIDNVIKINESDYMIDKSLFNNIEFVESAIRTDKGMILVPHIKKILTWDEEENLKNLLKHHGK